GEGGRSGAADLDSDLRHQFLEEGEEDLIAAGGHFCATRDGSFYRGADELLIIGGGNSGLEEGLFLSQFAKRVRIVERNPELKAFRLLQNKVLTHPAIRGSHQHGHRGAAWEEAARRGRRARPLDGRSSAVASGGSLRLHRTHAEHRVSPRRRRAR